jgi:hypothetical protein
MSSIRGPLSSGPGTPISTAVEGTSTCHRVVPVAGPTASTGPCTRRPEPELRTPETASRALEPGMVTTLPERRHWAAPVRSETAVVPGSPWLPDHGRISTRSAPVRSRYVGEAEPACQLSRPSPRSYELSVP